MIILFFRILLQNRKIPDILNRVIHMEQNNRLRRLWAEEEIGDVHHIAVTRHEISSFPLHWHNYFELEIILSGMGKHILNGKAYDIGRGSVYILTPVDFHAVDAVSPLERINISFEDACLSQENLAFLLTCDGIKCQSLESGAFDRIVMCAELLRYECESGGSCKQQLLEYILSKLRQNMGTSYSKPADRERLTGIQKAVTYMQLHFRERITLKQLSGISGYSETYFSELFRKTTGQSYIDRLQTLRLRYAAVLLSNGLRVTDACYESGFGSISSFQVAFKKKYGVSPGLYRDANGNLLDTDSRLHSIAPKE